MLRSPALKILVALAVFMAVFLVPALPVHSSTGPSNGVGEKEYYRQCIHDRGETFNCLSAGQMESDVTADESGEDASQAINEMIWADEIDNIVKEVSEDSTVPMMNRLQSNQLWTCNQYEVGAELKVLDKSQYNMQFAYNGGGSVKSMSDNGDRSDGDRGPIVWLEGSQELVGQPEKSHVSPIYSPDKKISESVNTYRMRENTNGELLIEEAIQFDRMDEIQGLNRSVFLPKRPYGVVKYVHCVASKNQ